MSKIYTYSELKESKIIYDRKPPAFGVIITFMTLIFVVSVILWAGFSTKTYVVKADGLVASEGKINIMNKVSGNIDKINVYEGEHVKKGDVLIEINSFQVELQIVQIQANVDFFTTKLDIMERLIVFINNYTLNNQSTTVNPFDNNNPNEMKAYSDAQTFIDYIKSQENAAKNESTEEEPREYTQEEVDGLKVQFLSQQYATLDEYNVQVVQYSSQLAMYKNSLAEYKVIAGQDGIVHLTAGLTIGTVLQAGILLGSISSPYNADLFFETVVSATDRAKIATDDSVEIVLNGVMQSEYGILTGKIIEIASDSTQTEDGAVFFRVKIKPDKTQLKDKKGNIINLTIGMLAESRIKYDETTWLKWAIEQIGVKFK
ncbi:MAG: HlyD family secretion protein [Clostridiales bacterium]|jgi:multidrug resistance efflux pump|nr:HlyD family secretion protein [Clostridiales bacterium]